jgi:hypothetical protein
VLTHADLRAAVEHPERFPPDVVAAAAFVDHERSLQSLLDPGEPVTREDAAVFVGLAVNLGILRRHFGPPLPPLPADLRPPLTAADLEALATSPGAGPEAEAARWLLDHEPQRRRLTELDATVAAALGVEPPPPGTVTHESLLALAADRQAHDTCEPAHMT